MAYTPSRYFLSRSPSCSPWSLPRWSGATGPTGGPCSSPPRSSRTRCGRRRPWTPPVLQTVADLTQAAGLFCAVWFFLVFPDGRFASSWARLWALAWAVYCLAWGLFPNAPWSLIDPFGASFAAFLILMLPGWMLGLTAPVIRYRRAEPRQRAQTRWVLLAAGGACIGYALVYLPGLLLSASDQARLLYDLFGVPVFWLLALPIPIALAVSMLRHHLFDPLKRRIDAIVDRIFFRREQGASGSNPDV